METNLCYPAMQIGMDLTLLTEAQFVEKYTTDKMSVAIRANALEEALLIHNGYLVEQMLAFFQEVQLRRMGYV